MLGELSVILSSQSFIILHLSWFIFLTSRVGCLMYLLIKACKIIKSLLNTNLSCLPQSILYSISFFQLHCLGSRWPSAYLGMQGTRERKSVSWNSGRPQTPARELVVRKPQQKTSWTLQTSMVEQCSGIQWVPRLEGNSNTRPAIAHWFCVLPPVGRGLRSWACWGGSICNLIIIQFQALSNYCMISLFNSQDFRECIKGSFLP